MYKCNLHGTHWGCDFPYGLVGQVQGHSKVTAPEPKWSPLKVERDQNSNEHAPKIDADTSRAKLYTYNILDFVEIK